MRVAMIGLGHMGRAMAERLAERGCELRVWNRSPGKAAGLRATVCDSPAEAARGSEFVLTSLAADEALREVLLGERGLLAGLDEGAVHAGTSTISYDFAAEVARLHAERGRGYVAAPVLGRPDAAAAGRLWVLAGGDERARKRCAPLFEAIGRGTFELAEPAQANLAKLAVNFLLAGTIELLGEAMALGDKGGIAPARLAELIGGTLFACPAIDGYAKRIAAREFEPAGFAMPLGFKDVRLAIAASEQLRAPLPSASVVHDRLLAALARGLDRLDWSALSTIARLASGLDQ